MAGACPPILHPLPFVVTGLITIEAVTQHGQAFKLRRCRQQLR